MRKKLIPKDWLRPSERVVIGVTGGLAAGKSSIAKRIAKELGSVACAIIEIDDLRRYALWVSKEAHHIEMRKQVAEGMGIPSVGSRFTLDREILSNAIFQEAESVARFGRITTPFLKQDIQIRAPVTLLVWTRLLEDGYAEKVTEGLVLVHTSKLHTRQTRVDPDLAMQRRFDFESNDEQRIQQAVGSGLSVRKVLND